MEAAVARHRPELIVCPILKKIIPESIFGASLLWWRFYTFYVYIILGAIVDKNCRIGRNVRIANDRGDLMPRNAMAAKLQELGAPVPEVAAKSAPAQAVGEAAAPDELRLRFDRAVTLLDAATGFDGKYDVITFEEGLARIPRTVREGSLALGATKAETLWKVVLPMAVGGSAAHVLTIDYALRPVLVSLGAVHVTRGQVLLHDEIGRALYMSPATAKTHVGRVLAKLGARDRAQLVVFAYETGLVRPG